LNSLFGYKHSFSKKLVKKLGVLGTVYEGDLKKVKKDFILTAMEQKPTVKKM
jgi:hypothetical protein